MKLSLRSIVGAAGTAILLSLLPVTFSSGASAADDGSIAGFVRVSNACGQATECSWSLFKICSTHNGDHKRYRCSAGCDDDEEVEVE